MPRLYTRAQKQEALRRLAANNGSAWLTAKEMDIPESTLQNWWKVYEATSDADKLNELRRQLIAEAMVLASYLNEAVVEVPFNHRASALNQMIDKILRITEVLEEDEDAHQEQEKETPVIRVEYVDEHGQVHSTPPDAENGFG